DTFKLDNSGGTASLTGTIDGGLGANTLDYSAFSGAVAVTLASASSGSAQNTGGFSNIQTLKGNGASTTLTGSGTDSTFTINAANAGTVNDGVGSFAFNTVNNLAGGAGADTFKLDNSGGTASLTGTIDGGLGANTLDYSAFSGAVAVTLASASSGSAQNTGGFSNIQT